MSLARFSVKNSLFINLLSLFILVAGIASLYNMRREAFPPVNYDLVSVYTVYPGASPEEVEKLVTIPLEKEIKGVDGIEETSSMSLENFSRIAIKIDPDQKDKDKVVTDIQRAVDRVKDLPADTEDPEVIELESGQIRVVYCSVSGNLSQLELQKKAEILEDILADIDGVAKISRTNWYNNEVHVEVNLEKLDELHLSFNEISLALQQANVTTPAGTLKTSEGDFTIRTVGEFRTKKDVEEVVIRANDLGNHLRVKDVALVTDGLADMDDFMKVNRKRAVLLGVVKKKSGDAIDIVDQVTEIKGRFEKDHPEISISFVDDMSYYIKRRLNVLKNNGRIGLIIVVLMLLLFLNRNIAIFTALGLPIAFLSTFAVMSIMGMSINLVTMFGLIMVLGILVDDGIIISENVFRYIEGGMLPREAAIKGTEEVMKPVVATVLTTIVAFLPLMFMSGILGKFIRSIPIVVIIALVASLVEALIILPSHLADFVKVRKGSKDNKVISKKEAPWFKKLVAFYTGVLQFFLKRRYWVLLVAIGSIIVSLVIATTVVKFVLFPRKGIEQFFIRCEAPIGTSLEETSQRMVPVENLVASLPANELENMLTVVGKIEEDPVFDPYSKYGSHLGQIVVYLTPEAKRDREARDIVEEFRARALEFKGLEKIDFEEVNAGPPVGKPVYLRIRGEFYESLEEIADKFKNFLHGIDGVTDIKDDYDLGKNELRVVIDKEKAASNYLTVGDVAATVRSAFKGNRATYIRPTKAEEEIDVVVRLSEIERNDINSFKGLLIANQFGNLVPLSKVAEVEHHQSIDLIRHLDGKRTVSVSAMVDDKKTTSMLVNRELRRNFKGIEKEYPGNRVTYGGEEKDTQEAMRNLSKAFILAAFLIFMILASSFNSLVQPLVVMMAIPFGIVGVIIAFLFHGEPLSFMAILGTVGLSGVVVNDSIVLVDFINRLRIEGAERRESIVKAGQLRLRPVILTTVTTVGGLMPTAYGLGGLDPFIKPMALALTWGLLFATILTLLVLPCIYAIIDDITMKLTHHTTVKRKV